MLDLGQWIVNTIQPWIVAYFGPLKMETTLFRGTSEREDIEKASCCLLIGMDTLTHCYS